MTDHFLYFIELVYNRVSVHILPRCNFRGEEGCFKQVICYTNLEEVKLFINDRPVGVRSYECPRLGAVNAWNDGFGKRINTHDLHLSWDVPFEPGVLRAEGYRNGELVGMDAGDLSDLSKYSSPDRKMLSGKLLAIVRLTGKGDLKVSFSADNMQKYDILKR
ncbi:MAG: DUF4982 domain-containing protein [Lachnospiraceae bacterium]|nr:DUF4982 domain-containing protein [Lachnospiraceae bacterium]